MAYGDCSHAEGYYTIAGVQNLDGSEVTSVGGHYSHAEGELTYASA